ncbi:MAG TPA: Mur ligase family protein [Saprospiraceae bacterium]|nr:Mur ligase family protein [Saprospiraceae bacterium]
MSKIHLIAIGGSVMHNVALALVSLGHEVSGSDDQIFEPAKSRLQNAGILPEKEGWFFDKITSDIDIVILGMHAKSDNPELLKAIELNIKLYSFPEFVAEQYSQKTKIVVAGSHGKTTTTAMLMHILEKSGLEFDYLVGALLKGFKTMVSFSNAKIAVIEGDEYFSSCLDMRPKFIHYKPQIAVITGIAWDHYNVFPKYELYVAAFASLIQSMEEGSSLIYFGEDKDLQTLVMREAGHLHCIPYFALDTSLEEDELFILDQNNKYPMQIFGKHNMENLHAVILALEKIGIQRKQALEAFGSFEGAHKRLQIIKKNEHQIWFLDFAHAPSKVKATVNALRERYVSKKILIIMELHTYSSLNKEFIPQYYNSTQQADSVILFIDAIALEIKRMSPLLKNDILKSFGRTDINYCTTKEDLKETIDAMKAHFEVIAFLGSGHFGGLDLFLISNE